MHFNRRWDMMLLLWKGVKYGFSMHAEVDFGRSLYARHELQVDWGKESRV